MSGTHIGSTTTPPVAFIRPLAAPSRTDSRPMDWIEATMRACEISSVVDIAKRPDAGGRLSRLLGL